MKINSVQRDIALKQGSSGLLSDSNNFREKSGVSMCEKNRGYNADYCGSFTGQESKAAATVMNKTFGDKILTSKWFNSLASAAEKHNVATSALIALGLAGVLRPATTMALPGKKDKDDKIYASGHAMASGVMGFIVSLILTSPLDDAFTKCYEASKKLADVEFLKSGKSIADKGLLKQTQELINNPKELEDVEKRAAKPLKDMFLKLHEMNLSKEDLKQLTKEEAKNLKANRKFLELKTNTMSTLMKTMPDWVIAVPRATLTIALIPPILKYVFGIEKKKKSAQPVQDNNTAKDTPAMNFIEKPVFQAVKGGVK